MAGSARSDEGRTCNGRHRAAGAVATRGAEGTDFGSGRVEPGAGADRWAVAADLQSDRAWRAHPSGEWRGAGDHHCAVRCRKGRNRFPHHSKGAGSGAAAHRQGWHARADDSAPGHRPDSDPGAGDRLGRRADRADRHHGAAEFQRGGQSYRRWHHQPRHRQRDLSVGRRRGDFLHSGKDPGGGRGTAGGCPAVVRPERAACGVVPV